MGCPSLVKQALAEWYYLSLLNPFLLHLQNSSLLQESGWFGQIAPPMKSKSFETLVAGFLGGGGHICLEAAIDSGER